MSKELFVVLLPILMPGLLAIANMIAIIIKRSHVVSWFLTGVGFLVGMLLAGTLEFNVVGLETTLFVFDGLYQVALGLLYAAGFVVVIFSHSYLMGSAKPIEEYYLLLSLALMGAAVLTAGSHLVTVFLGFELLSISLVVLMAYLPDRPGCMEAGLKYFVMAAVSGACFLFGMALMYAAVGYMELSKLMKFAQTISPDPLFFAGLALVLVGVGFKLAIFPFHMWISDVYRGSPVPITAFVATVSKGAVLVVIVRLFVWGDGWSLGWWWHLMAIFAAASMWAGNLLALLQRNLKRLLAYSSITHLGYILVALLSGGAHSVAAAWFYFLSYMLVTLGAFGVVTALSHDRDEFEDLYQYGMIGRKKPFYAFVLAIMMFSLAGVPLTVGFCGKLSVLMVGIDAGNWVLIGMMLINSAIGIFVYLRVVVIMYMRPVEEKVDLESIHWIAPTGLRQFVLVMLSVLVVLMGVFPKPCIQVMHWAARSVF